MTMAINSQGSGAMVIKVTREESSMKSFLSQVNNLMKPPKPYDDNIVFMPMAFLYSVIFFYPERYMF